MLTNPAGVNSLTHAIIGCAIRVHREIGPGVLENVYNECMQYELRQEALRFDRERAVPLVYKGQKLKSRYYIDLVVEDRVIVELKTVVEIVEVHKKAGSHATETRRPAYRPDHQFQCRDLDRWRCEARRQPCSRARLSGSDRWPVNGFRRSGRFDGERARALRRR